jgi:MFS family permease
MFSKAYKRYVLVVITLVYTLNFVDRNLMILLLQPIKDDLHLSDTQLGVLTGIAFGLFYATLGIPIARLADRSNRVSITSVAIALWGLTVMACMFVTSFVQLMFARVAAAVGESGCMPPTCSMLGDYFPAPAERARAMAVYWLGAPLSALISFVAGGWLNAQYGWRITFLVMGAPALLVAILVKTTVVEPRNRFGSRHQAAQPQPRLTNVLHVLWRQPSARNLSIGVILYFMLGLGLGPWFAAFMIRNHGMGTAELGTWLGLIWSICGVAGLLLGGHAASRWFAGDERAQMRASAAMVGSLALFYVLFLLLPDKHSALAALVPLALASNFFFGPTFALLQRLVPDEMRATALAVVMLLANLIGMGVGPELVGILSDRFQPVLGVDSLRYAMLIMSLVALWAAYHFWQVGRTVAADLRRVAAEA